MFFLPMHCQVSKRTIHPETDAAAKKAAVLEMTLMWSQKHSPQKPFPNLFWVVLGWLHFVIYVFKFFKKLEIGQTERETEEKECDSQ